MKVKSIIAGKLKSLALICLYIFEPILSDSFFLRIAFYLRVGYWPNLKEPKSFNEKLQWLKLHDKHPEYGRMVDKVSAKEIVANLVGEEYLIPTIGIYNSIEEIEWDKLPPQFVIKSACDSGGVVICKDKSTLNIQEAINRIRISNSRDYSKYNKEYPYRYASHRYIAEKYITDESGYELKDYKFFCFNGKPRYVQLDFDRQTNHRRNIYDTEWNLIDLQILYPKGHDRIFPKPINFEKMLEVAAELSKGIPHVRVDLYNVNGKIYFGEMTFFHGSGMEYFIPVEWDYKFGEYILLPSSNI